MRVIEQLVQHFWARGALTREEALYLVRHGFVREADLAGLVDQPAEPVAEEESAGASRKDAIRAVVVRTGLPKRTVYDAVVAAKGP